MLKVFFAFYGKMKTKTPDHGNVRVHPERMEILFLGFDPAVVFLAMCPLRDFESLAGKRSPNPFTHHHGNHGMQPMSNAHSPSPKSIMSHPHFHIFEHEATIAHRAGSTLFAQGEKGDFMYVIHSGQVELSYNQHLIEVAEAGDIIGEMSLIDGHCRSMTAIAKTDCKVVEIDQNRFRFLVQETPFFAMEVMQVLTDRIRSLEKLV